MIRINIKQTVILNINIIKILNVKQIIHIIYVIIHWKLLKDTMIWHVTIQLIWARLLIFHVLDYMIMIFFGGRFGKSAHISMISNSVTHLRSYTNSAIADIAGNFAAISPVTPRDRRRRRTERRRLRIERRLRIQRRRLRIERRYRRIEWPPHDRRRRCPKRRRLHIERRRLRIERQYRRIEWLLFHDGLLVVHDVLHVFHDVLLCLTMFYDV